MGWRYRKSIGKTFRINISKSGVGYSVGTKGFRITKTAKGTTRKTITIPGTGVSHITESKDTKKTNYTNTVGTEKKSIKYQMLFWCLTFILAVSFPFLIVDTCKKIEDNAVFYNYDITYLKHEYHNGGFMTGKYIEIKYRVENKSKMEKEYSFDCWLSETENSVRLAEGEIKATVKAGETEIVTGKLYLTDYYINNSIPGDTILSIFVGKINVKRV